MPVVRFLSSARSSLKQPNVTHSRSTESSMSGGILDLAGLPHDLTTGSLSRELLEGQATIREELAALQSIVHAERTAEASRAASVEALSSFAEREALSSAKLEELSERLEAWDEALKSYEPRIAALEALGAAIVRDREENPRPDAMLLGDAVTRHVRVVVAHAVEPLAAGLRSEVESNAESLRQELHDKVLGIQSLFDDSSKAASSSSWNAGWRAGQINQHIRSGGHEASVPPKSSRSRSRESGSVDVSWEPRDPGRMSAMTSIENGGRALLSAMQAITTSIGSQETHANGSRSSLRDVAKRGRADTIIVDCTDVGEEIKAQVSV